jgi:hypothetical protein
MNAKLFYALLSVVMCISSVASQNIYSPDLSTVLDGEKWDGKFTSVEITKKDSADALTIHKAEGDQFIWIKNFKFENGSIEFDAKGKSGPPQSSFIGIGFRVADIGTYDVIYFRPFNFRSPNPVNKSHSVQYTSLPDWTWSRLRSEHPGEYEKGIDPAPNGDEWFHARIEIRKPVVKVYVNGADEPSLVVNELSDRTDGSVGIMCNVFGVIANLKIINE